MTHNACISNYLSKPNQIFILLLTPICLLLLPVYTHARAVDIIASKVIPSIYADTIEALGTIRANETVIITANTTEKIAEIHFKDGQIVQKDDMLVQLEKEEQVAELKAAKAALEQARLAYKRAKDLQGTQAVSEATLADRAATLKRQEANVEAIESRIQDLTIKAPFSGVLGLREVSPGPFNPVIKLLL